MTSGAGLLGEASKWRAKASAGSVVAPCCYGCPPRCARPWITSTTCGRRTGALYMIGDFSGGPPAVGVRASVRGTPVGRTPGSSDRNRGRSFGDRPEGRAGKDRQGARGTVPTAPDGTTRPAGTKREIGQSCSGTGLRCPAKISRSRSGWRHWRGGRKCPTAVIHGGRVYERGRA